MSKIELLAPAGNEKSFMSALNSGADAIYLGIGDFNARGNIENFNEVSLEKCVKKAHLFGVKVYITLNILVMDSEIQNVLDLVRRAIKCKVDAFIVQDIGLASLLKQKFEGIELHASTQMGVSNFEGACFLKDVGFSRIVLARETPLDEIKRIKDNLDIEIEYFVQGALCVSYSGNCYLCSILANASGNRGKCKQFCRLPFKMETPNIKKEGYFLSTKDFCMLPCLKELSDAGVTSFKIEGRARREGYVAGAVKIYRDVIDNDFKFGENDIQNLKKLFNRGDFIQGYLKDEKIIYNKTQNHIGITIGKIISINKGKRFNEVVVSSSHALKKGDALKFFVNEKEIESVGLQDVRKCGDRYIFTTTANLPKNADVHLIVDSTLEQKMLSLTRKHIIKGKFVGEIGKKAKLTLIADNVEVCSESQEVLEEAKGQPLTRDDCLNQISKMGGNFVLESLETNIENVFMAKSQLNQLRRTTLEQLEEKILSVNQPKKVEEKEMESFDEFVYSTQKNQKENSNKEKSKIKIIYFNSLENLEKYLNEDDYLVYNPQIYNEKEIQEFCEKYKDKTIFLSLPVLANEKDVMLYKNLVDKHENLGVVANNYYGLVLTSPKKTIVGSNMNITNNWSIKFYSDRGYDKIILSKENFDFSQIQKTDAVLFEETGVRKTLMHFRHCPFKENLGGDCKSCRFNNNAKYKLRENEFLIRRKRTSFCQFELIENKAMEKPTNFNKVVEIL